MTAFTADLWRWESRRDDWWFVSLPRDFGADIADKPRESRGFQSVRVRATIGDTTWETSIFRDSRHGSYALPIKKAVRVKENIDDGARVDVEIELLG